MAFGLKSNKLGTTTTIIASILVILIVYVVILVSPAERGKSQQPPSDNSDKFEILNKRLIHAGETGISWDFDAVNNTDQVIKEIIWKIEIYDSLRQIKVDELYTATRKSRLEESEQLSILPGEKKSLSVMFTNYNRQGCNKVA